MAAKGIGEIIEVEYSYCYFGNTVRPWRSMHYDGVKCSCDWKYVSDCNRSDHFDDQCLSLEIAESKKETEDIVYVLQDATELELPFPVPAMVSIGDSMNYITDYGDFMQVLKKVRQFLEPDGIFVFDLKTRKYFSDIGETTIAEDREECSFIWENYFDEETNINEYYLSVFVRGEDGRYDKYEEEHFQRGYTLDEVKKAVEAAGLKMERIYEAFSEREGSEENDRVYVVVRNVQDEEK